MMCGCCCVVAMLTNTCLSCELTMCDRGPGRVRDVLERTPCQVGWGWVGVWVESGTGRGRVGVDSVSSWVVSDRGPGRVRDGSGSCWGRLHVKLSGVGLGSGSSRG